MSARSKASCRDWNDAVISSAWPLTRLATLRGCGMSFNRASASAPPSAKSPCSTWALTTATRFWPMRWMSAGPSATVMSASAASLICRSPASTSRFSTSALELRFAFVEAHADVHPLVAPSELGRHVAADLPHHPRRHVGHQEAGGRGALLVELDLQLRVARADARFHIAERRRGRHLGHQPVSHCLDGGKVVACDFHFQRRRETEELRAVHLELGAGDARHHLPRQGHDERLVVRNWCRRRAPPLSSPTCSPPAGSAGVQLAAGTGHGIGPLDDGIGQQLLLGRPRVPRRSVPAAIPGSSSMSTRELALRQRRDQFQRQRLGAKRRGAAQARESHA